MHFHWQNLNDRHEGGQGLAWRHGRAWWRFGAEYGPRARTLHVEWTLAQRCSLRLEVTRGGTDGDEHGLSLSIGVGFASLDVAASGFGPLTRHVPGGAREYGFYLAEGDYLHVSWGADPWGPSGPGIKRRSRGWFVRDVLFGRAKHESVPYRVESVAIPMPEAAYPATVSLERATWKRPRWPIPLVVYRARIDVPHGVPAPGKWGDDGLYGLMTQARTIPEAIGAAVRSVEDMRRKHGGRGWRPSPEHMARSLRPAPTVAPPAAQGGA